MMWELIVIIPLFVFLGWRLAIPISLLFFVFNVAVGKVLERLVEISETLKSLEKLMKGEVLDGEDRQG